MKRHLLNYMSNFPTPTHAISETNAVQNQDCQLFMPPREGRKGEVCLHEQVAGEFSTLTSVGVLCHV